MFDPYRDWLGIYDERRPPTLYQLLCVSPLESDPRAIEAAAARQLAKLQNYLTGANTADAWRLLDEVALAKNTLLDSEKRSAYDAVFGYAQKPSALIPPPMPVLAPPPSTPLYSWGQPPPPASPPPPPPMPAIYQQLTAQMGVPQTPALYPPMPAPTPPVASSNQPANAFAMGSRLDEPSRDGLPTPGPIQLPQPSDQRSKLPLFLIGGLVAIGVVGGGIFLATQAGNNPTSQPEKEKNQVEVVDNTERKQPPVVVKKEPPKETPKKTEVAVLPKKKEPPKVIPKNDPPPPKEIAEEFKQAVTLRGHATTAAAVAVAPDGKQLFSAGNDLAIFSWTPDSDKPLRRHTLKDAPPVGLALMGGGKLAAIPAGATLYILDLQNNTIKRELDNVNTIVSVAAAADGQHLLSATNDGQLRWWDIDQQAPDKTLPGDPAVQTVAVSPDGQYALSGNGKGGGQISLWNLSTGGVLKKWKAHTGDVTALAFSVDGKKALSAGSDNLLKTWDIPTSNPGLTLKGHEDVPLAVAFTADGAMMLSAGVDHTIRSWDAITGEPLRWMHKGEAKVVSLAIDPKNRFVIAGQNDGGVQLQLLPAVRPDIPPRATWVKPPQQPLPTPSKRDIDEAVKSLRDKYKADFALTMPEDLSALYDKLLLRAKVGPESPDMRFALFQEARDVAGKLGRMDEAFKTIEARTTWFDTDDLEDKAAALKAAAQATVTKNVAEAAVGVVEEAEKLGRPDIVDELLRQRELFPQMADAPELSARMQAAEKRWTSSAAEREKSRTLAAELQKDPDSQAANLDYGKYLAFTLGDWTDGLPKLLKGNDAVLQDLAKKELANPNDPKLQMDLGKGWFDYATNADDLHKPGVLIRSKSWYEKALEKLPAADKLAVAVRVGEITKKLMGGSVSFARPGEPVPRRGFNALRTAMALESQWVVVGSEGFTPEGLVLKADGSLGSRFKLLDGARVEFTLIGDGRSIELTLNGQSITFQPAAEAAVTLTAERRGPEVRFVSTPAMGGASEEKIFKIAPNQLEPGPLVLNAKGPTSDKELRLKKIIVNGQIRPTN